MIFVGLQKSQAIQGRVIPAADISALVVAVAEPYWLIAAAQRFQDLNRLFIFCLVSEKAGKEINLLMPRASSGSV